MAVFPELPSPSMEDFTIRTAQSWRGGRKKLDNGVVLFVFVKDRKMRLEVGYGLEGALPDATAKQIVSDVIAPRFRAGDYAGGLEAGVDAILAATRGEYQAPARPATREPTPVPPWLFPLLIFVLFFVVIPIWRRARYGPRTYHRRGWSTPWWYGGGGSGFGGGGFGGGSSGGGGFSGGGGSFGGGGASGSW